MSIKGFILAVIAGLLTELFFRLVKYKDALNRNYPKPKYNSYDNYIDVIEYVSGGNRRWLNYSLFRILPPFVILLLLAALLKKYAISHNGGELIIVAGTVSVIFRDGYNLFQKKIMRKRRMACLN